MISEQEYRAPGVAARLAQLLADQQLRQALDLQGPQVAAEDGAGVAAAAIEALL